MTNTTTPRILFCEACGWEMIRISRERFAWTHRCLGCGMLYSEREGLTQERQEEQWATKERIALCRLEVK